MSDKFRWYALYVRSRSEKMVHNALLHRKIDTYLPMVLTIRQWKDRKKKVYVPLFKGYVFIRIDLQQSLEVLMIKSVVRIIGTAGKPIPIPDEQLHAVRLVLSGNCETEVIPFLSDGESVEIISGPLEGLRGIILRNSSPKRFVVSIDLIGRSVAVEVSPHLLKSVSDNKKS